MRARLLEAKAALVTIMAAIAIGNHPPEVVLDLSAAHSRLAGVRTLQVKQTSKKGGT